MRLILFVGLAVALTHCSSKKDVTVSQEEAPKFDKTLNSSTNQRGEKIGVRDDKVTVQKTVYLEEDLKKAQDEIEDLENRVYGQSKTYPGGIYLGLKTCRARLADPRLGGSGVPEPMEKWEKISAKDPDFNYHVDRDKNVVAVSEEDLASRISNLRKLKNILNDTYDAFQTKLDNCQQNLETAMIKNGMNPNDMKAQGEWVDGPNGYKVWKMKKPTTNDPEEMMKRKSQREKSSEE
ncbi:MAG: hypothetical protein EB120_08745 [Proteobacteria bacterium]|nr:hypothetical protein [Pseudomonadota bacterium]